MSDLEKMFFINKKRMSPFEKLNQLKFKFLKSINCEVEIKNQEDKNLVSNNQQIRKNQNPEKIDFKQISNKFKDIQKEKNDDKSDDDSSMDYELLEKKVKNKKIDDVLEIKIFTHKLISLQLEDLFTLTYCSLAFKWITSDKVSKFNIKDDIYS